MMRWYGRVIWPVGLDSRASAAALVWTARSETANATRIGHLRLACSTRSITQKWCGAAPTQYFEMFGNRGISKGWVGGPERSRDTTSDSHVKSRTSQTAFTHFSELTRVGLRPNQDQRRTAGWVRHANRAYDGTSVASPC